MGDGAYNVLLIQALVEAYRGRKLGNKGIGAFAKTAAPSLIHRWVLF
jgi:hypothetical protein